MSKQDDGGPAFPVQDAATWQAHGMSLRDYFAIELGAALIVSSAADPNGLMRAVHNRGCSDAKEWVAMSAYELADAMLAQRSKE